MHGDEILEWIRPVSSRATEELSASERRLDDGSAEPNLLDILNIPLVEHRPTSCQTENHLIAEGESWTKAGRLEASAIPGLYQWPASLWTNGYNSYSGQNDRIPEGEADALTSSLLFIGPENLRIHVQQGRRHRQVRAEFRMGTDDYNLVVTDPQMEHDFFNRGLGAYAYDYPCGMCVSIGEPFEGYRYKLVASIIALES